MQGNITVKDCLQEPNLKNWWDIVWEIRQQSNIKLMIMICTWWVRQCQVVTIACQNNIYISRNVWCRIAKINISCYICIQGFNSMTKKIEKKSQCL